MAVGWMIAVIVMAITIIGLPWTRAAFSIASYTLLPFGQKGVSRAEYTGRQDIGTGPLGILGNVLWLVLAGWWLALAHVVTAILLAITIVGIPFAWAPLGVAKVMQCLCAYFPIVESAAACSAALSRLRRE
jgi:uncharacterized membrane protein YccF (DUF307 family)